MRLRRKKSGLRVELTPLIDVVFLLLTFFVFALVLMVRADVLDVSLPPLGTGRPATPGSVVTVAIDDAGATFVDGEPVGLDGLAERVEAAREVDPEVALVLAVDERADAGALVRVAERLASAGLGEFTVLGRPATEGDGPDGGRAGDEANPSGGGP